MDDDHKTLDHYAQIKNKRPCLDGDWGTASGGEGQ